MADETWTTSAKLEGRTRTAWLVIIFWLWGVGGLIVNGMNFIALSGSVGVGTSAYLMVGVLLWIGGMLLFGIGALIVPADHDFKRPSNGNTTQ
jgi:hypothetical protein